MRRLYNNFINLTRDFINFFNTVSNLSKPQLNFVANCLVGMIDAESVVTTDIIKKIPIDYFDESLFDSKVKKFYRFLITLVLILILFMTPLFNSSFLTLTLRMQTFIFLSTICSVKIDLLFSFFL